MRKAPLDLINNARKSNTRGAAVTEYGFVAALIAILAIIFALFSGQKIADIFTVAADSMESTQVAAADESLCEQYERFNFDYSTVATYITPNIWNPSGQTEAVCVEALGGDAAPSSTNPWVFDWELPTDHADIIAYPSVVIGQRPWDEAPTNPVSTQLSAAAVDISYAYTVDATGTYSASTSTWILNQPESAEENIVAEVMIWVENTDQIPGGALVSSGLTINGAVWDLWADAAVVTAGGGSRGWDYFAFIRSSPQRSGSLSINDFTDYLISQGWLQSDDYMASLEFGFEVSDGTGTANLTSLSSTGLPDSTANEVQPFSFVSTTMPWNNSDTIAISQYLDIPGLNADPQTFLVTSSDPGSNPLVISNVEGGGTASSGQITYGTNLQVDAPYEGETRTQTLNVGGVDGQWIVTRDGAPADLGFAITNGNGNNYTQIQFANLGIPQQPYDFSVTGTGATAPSAQAVTTGTDTNGRTPNWGVVIENTAPTSGSTETITLVINGDTITYQVATP